MEQELNEAEDRIIALEAEISQLRHGLLNEQAASRMAHEVVARNRALEAENAQLRHALANAEVSAGFAKEMAEKVKVYREVLERIADAGCHSSEVDAAKRYGLTWRADVARRALESQP